MSLIITRNFKRANAQDAVARDSIADKEREYTRLYELAQKNITFYAAKGDSAKVAEWKRKADEYKRLAQEATDAAKATDAKDSAATDANFKKGDKVYVDWFNGDQDYATVVKYNPSNDTYDVRLESGEIAHPKAKLLISANSRAADACGTDAKLQKGDKVRVWQQPVYGKLGEVVEATNGSMEYTVNVEGKDYPRIDYRRIVKVSNTAGDAAEFRVGQRVRAKDPRWAGYQGHALGNGVYTVKKVDWDGTVKLNGFLDVWISPSSLVEANDACGNGKDRCGRDNCGKDGDSEYELGMKVLKAVGKVEDEIGAGVRRAKQLVNNVPDEDVRRRLNRKLDDIEKIADSFEDTFI